MRILCRASPSLALVKYWGKREGGANLPATPSLALTLGGLETLTAVSFAPGPADRVVVDGRPRDGGRFEAFFSAARSLLGTEARFEVESRNGFPGGAGLASSSSGFAALALGLAALVEATGGRPSPGTTELSRLARVGSASAARAVFGGFTLLEAGAEAALPLLPASHWPALRVVAAVVDRGEKALSSRDAMESTRKTSPYYDEWVRDAPVILARAKAALLARDLPALGEAVRLSYSRMHASALAAEPPLLYWLPASLALIRACAELRASGVGAWETMDAGPQVKVLCLKPDLDAVRASLRRAAPEADLLVAAPGPGPELSVLAEGAPLPEPRSGPR